MRSEIHMGTRVRRSKNPLTNYTKLSKTTISALWKSKKRIQQTDKHVFALQWKILWFCGILPRYTSIHQSPMNTVSSNRAKKAMKTTSFSAVA